LTRERRSDMQMASVIALRRRELPWTSRYTWEVAGGFAHPRFTYDFHLDAEAAEFTASCVLRAQSAHGSGTLILREAHVKGPEDAEPGWRKIELHP
jgi:hypothetical protein